VAHRLASGTFHLEAGRHIGNAVGELGHIVD
jgi:hypothetical protein